jgi:hypothetical protein
MKSMLELLTFSMTAVHHAVTGSHEETRALNRDPHVNETFRKINRAKGFDAASVRQRHARLNLPQS